MLVGVVHHRNFGNYIKEEGGGGVRGWGERGGSVVKDFQNLHCPDFTC